MWPTDERGSAEYNYGGKYTDGEEIGLHERRYLHINPERVTSRNEAITIMINFCLLHHV